MTFGTQCLRCAAGSPWEIQQPPPPAWAALLLCDLGGCLLLGLSPLGRGSAKALAPALKCSCPSASGALSIPSPWRRSLKSFRLQLVHPSWGPEPGEAQVRASSPAWLCSLPRGPRPLRLGVPAPSTVPGSPSHSCVAVGPQGEHGRCRELPLRMVGPGGQEASVGKILRRNFQKMEGGLLPSRYGAKHFLPIFPSDLTPGSPVEQCRYKAFPSGRTEPKCGGVSLNAELQWARTDRALAARLLGPGSVLWGLALSTCQPRTHAKAGEGVLPPVCPQAARYREAFVWLSTHQENAGVRRGSARALQGRTGRPCLLKTGMPANEEQLRDSWATIPGAELTAVPTSGGAAVAGREAAAPSLLVTGRSKSSGPRGFGGFLLFSPNHLAVKNTQRQFSCSPCLLGNSNPFCKEGVPWEGGLGWGEH